MIRLTFTLVTLLLTSISFGQEQTELKLSGQIFNFPSEGNKIEIVQNKGNNNDTVVSEVKVDKKGNFSSKVQLPTPDYYLLRLPDDQQINIVVTGEEKEIKIYGDGKNIFFHANIVGSEASTKLMELSRYNYEYKSKLDSANQYLRANPDKQKEVNAKFTPVFEAFKGYRQRFMNENPTSPALVGVLSTFNLEKEFPLYEKAVKGLEQGFSKSPTVQRIVEEYESNKEKMKANQPLSPGSEAKEIALPNPDGEIMKLSDYRGKYVLIDFWASWCGFCRKENPNVVELYKKYKEEGFQVYSVSLDKDKARWVSAIEQDNLIWDGHVSDLKFWSSEAARDYNVSSIPFTVLVDPEGKIVNTRLRGVQLEETLKSIYGY
jgi:thiol-disulfide isomerase/thioredoxin